MKIAISTINEKGIPNYGNRLQAYAVRESLKRYASNVDLICLDNCEKTYIKLRIKYLYQKFFNYKLARNPDFWRFDFPKIWNFYKFDKKNLPDVNRENLKELNGQYDYFVVGSDQVWNCNWYEKDSVRKDLYLLTFAEPQKRVCYSPSFGIEILPDGWDEIFRKSLIEFQNISVREQAGAKIVKDLTGKDAEVLIDPTLMLNKEDWLKIAKKPNGIKTKKFVVTYFLGQRTEKITKQMQELENEGYTVYNLNDKENLDLFWAGPSEFLWLLANASLVLTDSFHACIFSFLFAKPFLVYKRVDKEDSMFSRMETLLDKLDLMRKYVGSGIENQIFECDYKTGFEALKTERQKVYKFLDKSFGK